MLRSRPPSGTSLPPARFQQRIELKGTSFQDAIAASKRREGERRYAEIVDCLEPSITWR